MTRKAKIAFISASRKLLPLAFIACAALWISEYWPGKTREAQGLVYERTLRGVAEVARYFSGMAKTGETRLGIFNKNPLYYRVCTTKDTIKQVFDHYTEFYRFRAPRRFDPAALLASAGDAANAQRARDITQRLEQVDNVYREETDEMGLFGVIDLGPNWQADLSKRGQDFLETGLIEKLGKAKMIVAFRPKKASGTTFITFWPGEGFNINRLMPPAEGADAPGRDLDDVPRCPGLRRTATVEERASFASGYVGVFESNQPITGLTEFYQTALPRRGWERQALPQNRAIQEEGVDTLFFAKGTKECLVMIRPADSEQVTQVIVMCRWPSQP